MARSSWSAVALVVAAVVLLTLPGALASGGGGGPSSPALAPPPPGPTTNASLTLEAGHNLSSLFWGTTVSPRSRLLPNEGSLTTGTPVSVVVWPGAFAGDEYDPLGNMARGLTWTPSNQATTPLTNESQFVTWCKAIHCAAILQVSGEIDNPSIAADVVAYTVNKTYTGPVWETNGTEVNVTIPGLDFRPVAWEIGNEPALWAYWDEPWGQWHPYQTPNSAQYAQEENAYFLAMDHANSSYRPGIIGLPGIGRADSLDSPATWVNNVISENGPNLTGIATHIYPARNLPSGQSGLVQFYDQISPNDPSSFLARTEDYAVPVAAACRIYICGPDGNSTLPIYVTEVGTSLSHTVFGGYSVGFPGALGMAMEGIEAMSFPNTTVASIDLFQSVADTNNGWFNNSGGGRPTYTLYSRIFTHLGTDAFPVNVTGDTNVSAIATVAPNDSDRRDLLVTNENITTSASFNLGFLNRSWYAPGTAPLPTFAAGSPVEVWEWNATTPSYNYTTGLTSSDPQTPVPVATYYNHGLPVNWTLPPQSMALFETYNAPAYPVNFTADLTPPGSTTPIPHWFIQVDGWNISSTEASETLLLPPGEHVTSGTPLLTPEDGTDQKSRWVPNLPPIITTGNAWAWVNFSYIRQWAVAISWNGSRGTVLLLASASASSPPSDGGLTWWNDSQPLQLEFRTAPGYAFDRWDGAGSGGYSGYSLFATLTPTGPVEEKAVFLPGTEVMYSETGLASGTPWSVSLRDYSLTTTNTTLTFYEAPGNWSDQISNVSGYQLITPGAGAWWQRSITVGDAPVDQPVRFSPISPPGPYFTLTFRAGGLPAGGTWRVTVRNVSESAGSGAPIVFSEHPGAYAAEAGAAGGFTVITPLSFTLGNAPLTVTVDFQPQNVVIWNETGLGPGLNWSVLVNGASNTSSGGWVTTHLLNGTYSFTIPGVRDYVPSPGTGTLDLTGSGAIVEVRFLQATFSVTFAFTGLPAGAAYQVRLSDSSERTTLDSFGFQIPNGTYTYDVSAPTGYYPSPSHGNVTIAGRPTVIAIAIHPTGPGPNPPTIMLLIPAATTVIALGLSGVGVYVLLGAIYRRRTRAPN